MMYPSRIRLPLCAATLAPGRCYSLRCCSARTGRWHKLFGYAPLAYAKETEGAL